MTHRKYAPFLLLFNRIDRSTEREVVYSWQQKSTNAYTQERAVYLGCSYCTMVSYSATYLSYNIRTCVETLFREADSTSEEAEPKDEHCTSVQQMMQAFKRGEARTKLAQY